MKNNQHHFFVKIILILITILFLTYILNLFFKKSNNIFDQIKRIQNIPQNNSIENKKKLAPQKTEKKTASQTEKQITTPIKIQIIDNNPKTITPPENSNRDNQIETGPSLKNIIIDKTVQIISKVKDVFTHDDNTTKFADIKHNVPFTTQSPFAEWSDPRQQDACEESSLIMAWHWIQGTTLSKTEAKKEIIELYDFTVEMLGQSTDTSAEDTLKIFIEYYKHDNARISYEASIENIKKELTDGNIIIIPTDGTILKNKYYSPPGPTRHMIVVRGFDDKNRNFITNDPGTKRGENFNYNYDTVIDSIINYGSGHHEPLIDQRKVMIIIGK